MLSVMPTISQEWADFPLTVFGFFAVKKRFPPPNIMTTSSSLHSSSDHKQTQVDRPICLQKSFCFPAHKSCSSWHHSFSVSGKLSVMVFINERSYRPTCVTIPDWQISYIGKPRRKRRTIFTDTLAGFVFETRHRFSAFCACKPNVSMSICYRESQPV